jgi:hypothetical protein
MLIARTYDFMSSVLYDRIVSYQKGFFLTSLDLLGKNALDDKSFPYPDLVALSV